MEEKYFKCNLKNHDQREKVEGLVKKYEGIIMSSTGKLGRTNLVKCEINTGDHPPIAQKPYTVNDQKRKMINEEIEKMLKDNIIRESKSPWSSPVHVIKKKDGSNRFCIDYRKLNEITKGDEYPLPRIDDLLEQFEGANYFTTLDLASGYWQIEMAEKDREKTAFTCHAGLYEFNVMSFGLKNAPRQFQRMMNKLLKEWLYKFVNVYIDDIIIYSKTFEEHMKHVEMVLKRIQEANLMIKLKKCKWFEEETEYLGHKIGRGGIRPNPDNIEKIKNMKIPTNVKEVRAVLGLCSYYRKFIAGFSKIAKPLNELLKKDIKFEWTQKQQDAFEELKTKLISKPILEYPDFEKEFILITDASGEGLGAILAQKNKDDKEIVIAYASRSLKPAEKNYPITELECLAIVWGVEHFHKYLIQKRFTILTDHSALKTIKTAKIPKKGKRARWMMELQQYDFDIKHRAGKENQNADTLSRMI